MNGSDGSMTVMNPGSRRGMVLLLLLLSLAPPALLAGESDLDHDDAREMVKSGKIIPLESLLEQVRKTHPGKTLEVELERKRGRLVYELEVLGSDGLVRELNYDATNGEFLQEERDD